MLGAHVADMGNADAPSSFVVAGVIAWLSPAALDRVPFTSLDHWVSSGMIRLLAGDCRGVLGGLPSESVHTVVTSPPYYGLRSYLDASHADKHCEIGSEATPDEYLATMVGVFREVRRVLRRDGTCWVNMGDSYAAAPSGGFDKGNRGGGALGGGGFRSNTVVDTSKIPGIKPKDLLLMPARLALALQADGWWVRSDIIWHKPNPMPESVTDRPTSAHEHVFLLTRSARYFYDADAVREPHARLWDDSNGGSWAHTENQPNGSKAGHHSGAYPVPNQAGRNLRNVWTIATSPFSAAHFATFPPELAERCIKAGTSERGCCAACGKPWGRVVEKMPVGDWRTSDRSADLHDGAKGGPGGVMPGWEPARTTGWLPGCQCHGHFEERDAGPDWISEESGERKRIRVYVPDGDAPKPVPCVVLDPFIGAGTTALVSDRLQRDCIGIDLNTAYTEMAMERVRADAPLLAELGPMPEHPEESAMADLFTGMAAD